MSYKFLVWNVRHFRVDKTSLITEVAAMIEKHDPDVFGILEFQSKRAARKLIRDNFAKYDFGVTDSRKSLEVMIGWRRGMFDQVLYTQRREFQEQNLDLRPGGLLSLRQSGETAFENLLFLHTDSGKTERDYNNRQEMFNKIWSLNKALKALSVQSGESRLMALGDLNTMGRSKTDDSPTVGKHQEVHELAAAAVSNGMRMLEKSHDNTWRNKGGTRSNLDHVIASEDLDFQEFHFTGSSDDWEVEVDGWNNLPTNAQQKEWIKDISDHCALVGEVL